MKYKLIFLSFFCLTWGACGQTKTNKNVAGVRFDPEIRKEAEAHIETSKELEGLLTLMQVYLNSAEIQSYEADTLHFSKTFRQNKLPFKSFYLWKGDTLIIDGAFGLFGAIGFTIRIVNNQANLFHLLHGDDFPVYAYGEKDSLQLRIEAPCHDTKIILSAYPDSVKRPVIYGYVAFKSNDFYVADAPADEDATAPRTKMRNDMKVYFKAGYLSLEAP